MTETECYRCLRRAFVVGIDGKRRCVWCSPIVED